MLRRNPATDWLIASAALLLLALSAACAGSGQRRGQETSGRDAVADGLPEVCTARSVLPSDDRLRPVRERLRRAVAADSAVSVSIAVVIGARVAWSEVFGIADRENGTPGSIGTPYSIASVTKPVTAAAILRLVEDGTIELDGRVNEYLGTARLRGPSDWADRVTVRDLLLHRGGLPMHFHFIYEDEPYERPPVDETIRRYGIVVRPPGARSEYSNLGYGILERIVELSSRKSYRRFVEDDVFRPLGITEAWGDEPETSDCPPAPRYAFSGDRLPSYDFDHRGASVVFATAEAMARFGAAHFTVRPVGGPHALGREMLLALQTDTVTDPDGRSRGLGWLVRRHPSGQSIIEHSGGMPGVLSMLRVAPQAGVSVFAVSNSETSGLPGDITAAVLDTLLAGAGGIAAEPRKPATTVSGPADGGQARPPRDGEPWPLVVGRWCGTLETWEDRSSIALRVSADGGSARIAWPGRADPLPIDEFQVSPDGRVTGRIEARIDTDDAKRAPHYVLLRLQPGDHGLTGAAIAMAVPPVAERVRYGLPSLVRLNGDC